MFFCFKKKTLLFFFSNNLLSGNLWREQGEGEKRKNEHSEQNLTSAQKRHQSHAYVHTHNRYITNTRTHHFFLFFFLFFFSGKEVTSHVRKNPEMCKRDTASTSELWMMPWRTLLTWYRSPPKAATLMTPSRTPLPVTMSKSSVGLSWNLRQREGSVEWEGEETRSRRRRRGRSE